MQVVVIRKNTILRGREASCSRNRKKTGKVILAREIEKTFKMGETQVEALRSVSLAVDTGEIVTVLGKSGSGKTTLLNIVGGLEKPDKGGVLIAGKPIYKLKEAQLAHWRSQQIGYVFQTFNLVRELTVIENIRLPMDITGLNYNQEFENELLSMLDLTKRRNFYPEQLSGGERQRVAIARAMIKRPAIILADEPSGNIDSDASQKLMDYIYETNQRYGQTYLIVTHDRSWNQISNRSIWLRDGRISVEEHYGEAE